MNDTHTLLLDTHERFLANAKLQHGTEVNGFAQQWQAAAELGIVLAPANDDLGGIGDDGDFRFAFFHQRGEHLGLPELGPTLAGAWSIAEHAGRDDLVEAVGAGEAILALPTMVDGIDAYPDAGWPTATVAGDGRLSLHGELTIIRGAPLATHLVIPARCAGEPVVLLVARQACGVEVESFRLVDGAEAGRVTFDAVEAVALARGSAAEAMWLSALAEMIVAASAEAVGIGRAMLDQTVAYVRQRKQFGQAIGSFQVIQHRMVEMLVEVEQARSLALAAARNRTDPFLVSAAKVRSNAMLQFVADNAVQFHGGIGTTEELQLSRYFRRAMVLRGELGTSTVHSGRIEKILMDRLLRDANSQGDRA